MTWDLAALAAACAATPRALAAAPPIAAVVTDSRPLEAARAAPGTLFVALRGARHDGHAYVPAAIAAGVAAVMVDRAALAAGLDLGSTPALVVGDTCQALGAIAAHARRAHARPVVAITGSNGKTTTKELTAAALASRGTVHRTAGNLNNLIGVPQTLLAWPDDAWAAVVEMGMNAPGEIAQLTAMARPDVGVVLNVAPAHLGGPGLGSLAAVAAAKAELVAGLPDAATVVLNADDTLLLGAAMPLLAGRRLLRFGRDAAAEVRLVEARPVATGIAVALQVAGEPCRCTLPLWGAHNAHNAAAAAAAAHALGLTAEAIATALPTARAVGARLRLVPRLPGDVALLDDSYNANPASMRAAFAALRDVAGARRRVAVLGDMLELGPTAAALHAEVGAAAAASGIHIVLALGEHGEALARAARAGGSAGRAYPTLEALHAELRAALRPGDVLLVKGSRGMRLERLLERLWPQAAGSHA